ncbi:MAG: carboxymuconolactone decarboxylase family protein [Acidimicrobiales bacterium]|jgi:alkylhydroperoxidase family enzyme|nr:carboxymuconolactone decarboxylase family protein [Acidimicrobiales bacterium]|tara:strand:- start:2060 stop:2731 length:672 start_codon:yes stop_codon:yes gene_type:complete
MPRLRQVRRSELHPGAEPIFQFIFGDRDPVDEPGTDTGTPGDWWSVFALVPDVFDHACAGIGLYRSRRRLIDPVLREIGQTRAGWNIGSRFVYSQHCKSCRTVGLSDEQINAISSWEEADCFDAAQRAVLAYTDDITRDLGNVSDEVFDELRAHLSDEEILEFTYIVCTYAMHGVMSRALKLEFDADDGPVEEVPGPHESLSVEHTRAALRLLRGGGDEPVRA